MTEQGDAGGFLSRWSRRKRAAASPAPVVPPEPVPADPEASGGNLSGDAAAEMPGGAPDGALPAAFDPADLPPVESLTASSDFTVFLRNGVPAALRHAALRRAWSLDPVIRDFTGPADYAWDFNAADGGMAGFSPVLTGDVKKLLAQAIGIDEDAPPEEPREDPAENPAGESDAPPAPVAQLDAGIAAEPDRAATAQDQGRSDPLPAAQDGADARAGVPFGLPGLPTVPSRSAAPAEGLGQRPPVRRRHGGALPS